MPPFRPHFTVLLAITLIASACGSDDRPTPSEDLGPEVSALVLTANGIGPFLVGQPFEHVRDGLADMIGGWDVDSVEQPDAVHVPTCTGPTTRLVGWGNFTALFTGEEGNLTFATWTYGFDPLTGSAGDVRSLNLVTPSGIGLGSSRSDIEAAFGSEAIFADAQPSVGTIVVIGNDSAPHLRGRLENDRLVLLERAPTCTV